MITPPDRCADGLTRRAPARAWVAWCVVGAVGLMTACQPAAQAPATARAQAPQLPVERLETAPRVGQGDAKAKDKAEGKADGKPAEAAAPYTRPEYPDNNRRNPFMPPMEHILSAITVGGDVAPGPGGSKKDPLERFPLNQLELIGIISEVAVPKAMFVDPDGFGHMVKKGDKIGDQKGRVVDIRDNEVEIEEVSGEGEDLVSKRTRVVRLRSTELTSESSDDLSEAERKALERLMKSAEGQKLIKQQLQQVNQGGQAPPTGGGVVPPR